MTDQQIKPSFPQRESWNHAALKIIPPQICRWKEGCVCQPLILYHRIERTIAIRLCK